MAGSDPTLLVLHGGAGTGPAERAVAEVRIREAKQSVGRALRAGFAGAIVATDAPWEFDSGEPGVVIEPDPPDASFDLSARLSTLLERHGVQRPVVVGAGALPLLDTADFAAIVASLAVDEPVCVTNNYYSSDLTGWYPADLLFRTGRPRRDNLLPRLLRERAGADVRVLPRTTATQFDLDTPTDVAILSVLRNSPGPFISLEDRARSLMPLLCNRDTEILVAGRVGSATWKYLEGQTACRVRVVSEERGLATAPPEHVVRSILGFIAEDRGPEGLFEVVDALCDGAFIDSRVVLEHARVRASREERFQSDLLAPEAIETPWLRELTRAALGRTSVLLGGHSLVSGGLMALNDAAWKGREAPEESSG